MLGQLISRGRLIWRLMRDPRIPFVLKMIIPLSLLYFIFPIDLVPDIASRVIPGLGHVDDVLVFLLGMNLFLRLCPRSVVQDHLNDMSSIGARYRMEEDEPPRDSQDFVEGSYHIVDEEKPPPKTP